MYGELNRYFIELQTSSADIPRSQETASRRAQAAGFIAEFESWLKQQALQSKVAGLTITALGQVQITCEADIIAQLRHNDALNIAAIRPGSSLALDKGARWAVR